MIKHIKSYLHTIVTMSSNWRLKNFRIDPLLDEKFSNACGPVSQQKVLNELIRKFVDKETEVVIDGIVVRKLEE